MSSSDRRKEEYKKLVETEVALDKQLAARGTEREQQMKLLHEYNDIKDATQVVIGTIANIEGTTVGQIHRRLNLHD